MKAIWSVLLVAILAVFWPPRGLGISVWQAPERGHEMGSNSKCTMNMYGNDSIAFYACLAQFAHQSNWFPSPIAGLFSYEIWNGYDGFWQNGAVLETLVNFVAYTNKTHIRYMKVINGGERSLYSLLEAYGPYPSFDDMGWYGISYARIYEVTGSSAFLQDSQDIFNWAWTTGWDTNKTCSGGFWFDNTFVSKQTITNAQMLLIAAKLYRFTHNKDYLNKMWKIYNYIIMNGLIDSTTYLVSDGAYANCTGSTTNGPTYNSGVLIPALVEVYKLTKNRTHIDLANKLAHAIIDHWSNPDGILVESCEPNCDDDGLMYKGIFARGVRYMMDELDDAIEREFFQGWLELQIESNIKNNMCFSDPISKCNITFKDGPAYFPHAGPVFGKHWTGPFGVGAPMQQTGVMDLLISAILPGTECSGDDCSYDPDTPAPQPLTCGSHPCPEDEDCCEYSPYSTYTCCDSNQKCNKTSGICYP